jgi:hypothetical protein
MSARHRLSKLLLRQGIIYSAGKPWTGVHEVWLRSRRFDQPGLQMAFEIAYDTLLATVDRRDRLDDAIAAMAQMSGTTSTGHVAAQRRRDQARGPLVLGPAVELGQVVG